MWLGWCDGNRFMQLLWLWMRRHEAEEAHIYGTCAKLWSLSGGGDGVQPLPVTADEANSWSLRRDICLR